MAHQVHTAVKIGTVCLFVLLISLFVAFRAGWLYIPAAREKQLTVPNESLDKPLDTTGHSIRPSQVVPDTSPNNQRLMSSSKSTTIAELKDFMLPGFDFSKGQLETGNKKDSFLKPQQVMSGSKSFIISGAAYKKDRITDTPVSIDTDSFYFDENEVMSSSKSGKIWIPRTDTGKKRKK